MHVAVCLSKAHNFADCQFCSTKQKSGMSKFDVEHVYQKTGNMYLQKVIHMGQETNHTLGHFTFQNVKLCKSCKPAEI